MFLQHLCTPALVYLVLGCIGSLKALGGSRKSSSKLMSFLISLASVLLLTYLLDYICKNYGITNSWYLLLFIFIMPFILLMLIMTYLTRYLK